MKHRSNPGSHPHDADAIRALYLPEVGTVEDVARHLRLSPATVRRLIREGKLIGRKLGGRWYVTRRALLGCLESGPPPSPGHAPARWALLTQASQAQQTPGPDPEDGEEP